MTDEFSKHPCLGQEWRRLLEAAEKTVILLFLCLGLVVSQSVMLVERLFVLRSGMRCFVERMCGCVCVVVYVWFLIIIMCPHCSPFCNDKTNSHRWRIVFGCLPALRMAQGPQRRSVAVSGVRLRCWLVCDGLQTLLS